MATHTYWALFVSGASPGTNGGAELSEVEMRASVGGADLCSGGAASASSGTAANAFDNTNGSVWASALARGLHRLAYQFASPVEVVEVSLRTGASPDYCPPYAALAWSDDGTAWTLLGPAFAVTQTTGTTTVASGFGPTEVAKAPGAAAHLATAWATVGVPALGAKAMAMTRRDQWGGQHRVAGDVAITGTPDVPVRRRVRLFDKASGALMREAWSATADGAYSFDHIRSGEAIVLAEDHTDVFNAVVSDAVMPVSM